MARSVNITTPMPTLEEFGKSIVSASAGKILSCDSFGGTALPAAS